MDPELTPNTSWATLNGKNADADPAPPADSLLKVWTGSEWAPAGVKVED